MVFCDPMSRIQQTAASRFAVFVWDGPSCTGLKHLFLVRLPSRSPALRSCMLQNSLALNVSLKPAAHAPISSQAGRRPRLLSSRYNSLPNLRCRALHARVVGPRLFRRRRSVPASVRGSQARPARIQPPSCCSRHAFARCRLPPKVLQGGPEPPQTNLRSPQARSPQAYSPQACHPQA